MNIRRYASVFAIGFGVLTLVAGGSVALGLTEARAAAGQVVEFVVWFNFLAGGAYVLAGYGMWHGRFWAYRLSGFIALSTAAVLCLFLWHVWSGGAHEGRTTAALAFRTAIWIVLTRIASPRS